MQRSRKADQQDRPAPQATQVVWIGGTSRCRIVTVAATF